MVKANWILWYGLLLAATAAYADPGIGRLFTSDTERTRLDKARQTGIAEINSAAQAEAELQKESIAEPPEVVGKKGSSDGSVTVNGWAKRENGTELIWMNGALMNASQLKNIGVVKTLDDGTHVIVQTASRRLAQLKAGQRVSGSGESVLEGYQREQSVNKVSENVPVKP